MKFFRNVALTILIILTITIIVLATLYNTNLSAVDKKNDKEITVLIPSNSTTKDIGKILKKNKLIRNEKFFYVYSRIFKINDYKASSYALKQSMSMEEIIEVLRKGNSYNPDAISITFQEGINMRKVISVITKNTTNKEEDILKLLKDEEYINSLIKDYWFITDSIKNTNIYYSLEGYLYPDTYFFSNKEVSVKDIFKALLDEMDKKLTPLKATFEEKNKSVHDILSLASIIELEGVSDSDRKNIASVFYNRLNKGMSLGSDATTYYAFKVEMNERDLKKNEIATYNPYNTRGPEMEGKIPVGPICNPSISSIEAALYPNETTYYYFVADKNRKVYFTHNYNEHAAIIKELKAKGVWFEW